MPTTTTLTPEHREFLLAGTRTAKLGYTAADGRPLIAPVWFTIDDDDVTFCTAAGTAKGRALQRDPRVVVWSISKRRRTRSSRSRASPN